MRNIPALAAGAAIALAVAPCIASAKTARLPCGLSIGPPATVLAVQTTGGVRASALMRAFPTVAAARQFMLAERFKLNTCKPTPIGGVPTVARRMPHFAPIGDQRFAANVERQGYVVQDIVFVRRGRSVAALAVPARADVQDTIALTRVAVRSIEAAAGGAPTKNS